MKKLGRNDLCSCGSGLKYKNCCQNRSLNTKQQAPLSELTKPYISEGLRLESAGNYGEAISAYRGALALQPESALIHAMLGGAQNRNGEYDLAIKSLRLALSLNPYIAEAHNELGLVYEVKGNLSSSASSFIEALKIKPDLFPARMNLGRVYHLQGQYKNAVLSYRMALSLDPTYFQAYHNLGSALEALEEYTEAITCYQRALELNPSFLASQIGLVRLLSRLVPSWHIPMMNDTQRNDAYYAALRSVITPKSNVFEIGTGSGLLSLMAAKLGAEQIVSCEAEPIIAATAEKIISNNGFKERVKVIHKRSTDVELGKDLLQPADVFVQEVFSSELLSEGVLNSIEDAKRRLLMPECKMIPAAASIMIALFGGDDIGTNLYVDEIYGFNLNAFNNIIPRRQIVYRNDLNVNVLSEEVEAFKFDFVNESEWQASEKVLKIKTTGQGKCLGVIQWIRLYFNDDIIFENHPNTHTPATSWPPCVYLNSIPVEISNNQIATVLASHDKKLPFFLLRGIENT